MRTEEIQIQGSIEPWLRSLELNNLSENTVIAYGKDLRHWAAWMELHGGEFEELDDAARTYLLEEQGRIARSSFVRRATSMKNWSKFYDAGILRNFKIRQPTLRSPRTLDSIGHVEKMVGYAHEVGKHDVAAIISLQGYAGLRIQETLDLTPESFDLGLMELIVRGKGDKVRIIPLTDKVWFELQPLVENTEPGERVIPRNYGNARKWVKKCFAHIGEDMSSHDLRATAATRMHLSGAPLSVAQNLLGHSDAKTTVRYMKAPMQDMRAALEAME